MWAPQTAAARKTPVCYQLNRVTFAEVSRKFSAKMLNVCGGLLSPLHQIFMGTHPVVLAWFYAMIPPEFAAGGLVSEP